MSRIFLTSSFALIEPNNDLIQYIQMNRLNHLPLEATVEFSADAQIIVSQTAEYGDAGLQWIQELQLSCDNWELLCYNGKRMLVAFRVNDGSLRVIGNSTAFPLLKITPNNGKVNLEVQFKSLTPLVI